MNLKQFLITCFIIFIVLLFFPFHSSKRSSHIACQIQCASTQTGLHKILEEYYKMHGKVPDTLEELATTMDIDDKMLECPVALHFKNEHHKYIYYPENFGDPDKVVITEDADNHYIRYHFKDIHDPPNEVKGDGYARRKKDIEPSQL